MLAVRVQSWAELKTGLKDGPGHVENSCTDCSRHGVDIRHHRCPEPVQGYGGSLQALRAWTPLRGHVQAEYLRSLCRLCSPVSLCTPVLRVSSKHGPLPVFSGPLGRKNAAREGVMGNEGYLARWFGVLLAGHDLPKGLLWGRCHMGRWDARCKPDQATYTSRVLVCVCIYTVRAHWVSRVRQVALGLVRRKLGAGTGRVRQKPGLSEL